MASKLGRAAFAAAVKTSIGFDPFVWRTQVVAIKKGGGRPITADRFHTLADWLERILSEIPTERIAERTDAAIDRLKRRHMVLDRSLLRGRYAGKDAASDPVLDVRLLLLDADSGITPELRQRLVPFLWVAWTSTSHTEETPKHRLAVFLRKPTDPAGHERLVAWIMDGYGKHHSDVARVGILPIRLTVDGVVQPFTVTGHVGRLLDLSDVPAGFVAADVPKAGSTTKPTSSPGISPYRLGKSLAAEKYRIGQHLKFRTSEPNGDLGHPTTKIHCVGEGHHDTNASASYYIGPDGEPWVTCHSHSGGNLNLHVGQVYWRKHFKPKAIKSLFPTAQQQLMYNARLLYDINASDRPDNFPWPFSPERIFDAACDSFGAELIQYDKQPAMLEFQIGEEKPIRVQKTSVRRAFDGINLLMACNHFVHGQHPTGLAYKLLSEWCQMAANLIPFGNCMKLFLLMGLVLAEDDDFFVTDNLRPSMDKRNRVHARKTGRHRGQTYQPGQLPGHENRGSIPPP